MQSALSEPVNGAKVGEGRPCRDNEEQKLEVDGSGCMWLDWRPVAGRERDVGPQAGSGPASA